MLSTELLPDELLCGTTSAVLARALEPRIELALWRREPDAPLAQWLDDLPASALPTLRLRLRAIEVPLALQLACEAAHTPAGPQREAWVADVAHLALRFAQITACELLRLRLDRVDGDACRRWHRDCVSLRLLCTYRGPGTEWVAPQYAEDALARPDHYDGPTKRMPTQAVALYKGCGFSGQRHDGGLVHRSPRIAGQGLQRLVLCLEACP